MIQVRKAQRSDARLIRQMILEMAQHERLPVFATEERLAEDGFGVAPKFQALIAEVDNAAAGYALFFDCYSSFQGPGVFLEDLFVRNEFRGKGVGQALLARIAARVVELGYCGIIFNVLDWNQSALEFFESAGAVVSDRKTLCLTGPKLHGIAKRESANASRGPNATSDPDRRTVSLGGPYARN
jgi:GNAT superfamily N-acetyltransferase